MISLLSADVYDTPRQRLGNTDVHARDDAVLCGRTGTLAGDEALVHYAPFRSKGESADGRVEGSGNFFRQSGHRRRRRGDYGFQVGSARFGNRRQGTANHPTPPIHESRHESRSFSAQRQFRIKNDGMNQPWCCNVPMSHEQGAVLLRQDQMKSLDRQQYLAARSTAIRS